METTIITSKSVSGLPGGLLRQTAPSSRISNRTTTTQGQPSWSRLQSTQTSDTTTTSMPLSITVREFLN